MALTLPNPMTTMGVGSNAGYNVPSWQKQLAFNPTTNTYSGNTEMLHKGSWRGLPDLGATELIGKVLGAEKTTQNGSNVLGPTNNNQSLVGKYLVSGWTDMNAITNDINAGGGSKFDAPSAPAITNYNIGGKIVPGTANKAGAVSAVNSVFPTSDYANYADQFDPSQFLASINAEYGAQDTFLNQQQSALQAAQDLYNKTIESDLGANLLKAKASKTSIQGKLDQNKVQAEQKKQDALSAAIRLYNELQMGYRQRFGGASSAGEASQAILGAEQQRQATGIGRDYSTAVAQIQAQGVDLENNYNTAIQELNTQKQIALRDVQTNFMNQLQQINSNRIQTTTAKEQAKRQLLLQLRNEATQIDASNRRYQQQLQLMREQQRLSLGNTLKSMQGAQIGFANNASNALGRIPTQVTSQIGQNNKTVSANVLPSANPLINSAVGYIAPGNFGYNEDKNKLLNTIQNVVR